MRGDSKSSSLELSPSLHLLNRERVLRPRLKFEELYHGGSSDATQSVGTSATKCGDDEMMSRSGRFVPNIRGDFCRGSEEAREDGRRTRM